jgi:sugar lactone lactonase YvrE
MKTLAWIAGGALLLVILLLVAALLHSDIDPVEYQREPGPGLTGTLAPNDAIKSAELLLEGVGVGPEDIAVGMDGWMYTGYRDGRIVRFNAAGEHAEFANTGGYPLGLRLDDNNNLIVADAERGLLSIAQGGAVEVLADGIDGEKFTFLDGLDIAPDGTIWFTDASSRFTHEDVVKIFLEGGATGRLLSFDPHTRDVTVHLDGLYFANGVAVDPRQRFVLVSETSAYRVRRLWLQGGEQGESDFFLDQLPGIPDNISVDEDGFFWIGFPSLRSGDLDKLGDKPLLRKLLATIPPAVWAPAPSYAFVAAYDDRGNVVQNLQQQDSVFLRTTGAVRVGRQVFITSLGSNAIGVL